MTLTRTELRSWLLLIGGIQELLDALDRQLRTEAGMSHDDYRILSRLHREPGHVMRMGRLARGAGFSPSRLSHAVARLEAEGWVQRARGCTDRRVVEVSLTAGGASQVREASPGHLAHVRRIVFETLGPDRARATAEAMDLIRRAAAESMLRSS